MRQLTRLKTKINTLLNIKNNLHYYITPKYFNTIIKTIQNLTNYHQNKQKIYIFSTPSLTLNLKHNLIKITKIKKNNTIKQINNLIKKKYNKYLKIHNSN